MIYTPTPDYYNDYIAHHGVKDMHWGVRNGPPYPLSSKISTGSRLKGEYGGNPGKLKKKAAKAQVKASKANKKAAGTSKINQEIDNTKVNVNKYNDNFISSELLVRKENGKTVRFTQTYWKEEFDPQENEKLLKDAAKDYKANEKQIQKICKEAIMDDPYLYDNWIKDYYPNMTKQQFVNNLEIKSVHPAKFNDTITAEISIWEKPEYGDNLLMGHSIDIEIDDLKKPKKPSYVSLNG